MKDRRLDPECIPCLVKKYVDKFPDGATRDQKLEYMRGVLAILANADPSDSAPMIVDKFNDLSMRIFGKTEDLAPLKSHFNSLVLALEDTITREISGSDDPLRAAIQYAAIGNYIDFGAVDSVDEARLLEFIRSAKDQRLDPIELEHLKGELAAAKKLVYLTDNCGEVVFDKIFISEIKRLYPNIRVTAIVRDRPVLNDATLTDAREIALDRVAEVIGNGSGIAGTELSLISREARDEILSADLVVSKGQGNFETLCGCGLNVYYVFMCKCGMFADRFGVPLYSGMLLNDRRLGLC